MVVLHGRWRATAWRRQRQRQRQRQQAALLWAPRGGMPAIFCTLSHPLPVPFHLLAFLPAPLPCSFLLTRNDATLPRASSRSHMASTLCKRMSCNTYAPQSFRCTPSVNRSLCRCIAFGATPQAPCCSAWNAAAACGKGRWTAAAAAAAAPATRRRRCSCSRSMGQLVQDLKASRKLWIAHCGLGQHCAVHRVGLGAFQQLTPLPDLPGSSASC